jgi:hypothetical protein
VRRLVKIAVVVLGIRAFLRWRKRRHEERSAETVDAATASDPADELRRKLAESRTDDAAAQAEPPAPVPVAERRAEVHEQGRAAVDEMTSSDEG